MRYPRIGSTARTSILTERVGDIGVRQIAQKVESYIEVTKKPPVVLIDYIQILAPFDLRATDKQNIDKAVL